MNNITIDIDDMINNIFNNPPKDNKSIHLSFDVNDEYELFKILVDILTSGLKILFGDANGKVNINLINLKVDENTELPSLDNTSEKKNNLDTKKNDLNLYYFTLKTDDIKYEISFDYL